MVVVLKLTLVVEMRALFVMPSAAVARSLSSTLDASAVSRRPHGDCDHTAVIAVVRWCWQAGAHRAGEVVGDVVSSLWSPLLAIDWAWLPRGMCVDLG